VQTSMRAKEIEIGTMIEKVRKWREMYTEFEDSNDRISLDDGAEKVRVRKKTLDCYLGLLRKGNEIRVSC